MVSDMVIVGHLAAVIAYENETRRWVRRVRLVPFWALALGLVWMAVCALFYLLFLGRGEAEVRNLPLLRSI